MDWADWAQGSRAPAEMLAHEGFVRLSRADFTTLTGLDAADAARLLPSWNRLPLDGWLRDGGRYRRRRHSCFVHSPVAGLLEQMPHRSHWQPVAYNALHGGIERMFEPVEEAVCRDPAWRRLLTGLGELFAQAEREAGREPPEHWYLEAHQFRIDTSDGLGRPTPEGAHRDGVDYVAVILVERADVGGGESRVFEADGPRGIRFVMNESWSALLLDDSRVIHETTPIRPDGPDPHRDTLVLTYRRGGFQAPPA